MNLGEWKVQIQYQPWSMYNRIYLIRSLPEGRSLLTHDGTIKGFKKGGQPSNDDYFAEMDDEQLQAFADALANHGVKTVNDHHNAGLLEATKAHLEDMRTLVFKKGGVK